MFQPSSVLSSFRTFGRSPAMILALVIVAGEWTGLARALLRTPAYAAGLDLVLVIVVISALWTAHRSPNTWQLTRLDVFILAYFGLALVQVLNSNVPNLLVGLEGFRKTAFTMLAYLIVRLARPGEAIPFLRLVALGSLFTFIWAIRQNISPLPIELQIIDTAGTSPMSFQSGPVLRAFAPTAGPFHLGILGGAVAIISLELARVRSVGFVLVGVLAGVALGISLTRANMLGTAMGLAAVVVASAPMRERLRAAVRALPLLAAIGLAVFLTARTFTPLIPPTPPPGGDGGTPGRASASGHPTLPNPLADRSLQFRFQYWAEQLRAIAERPLTGYGTSAAGDGFGRLYDGTGSRNFDPHSLYLKAPLELGVVGFVLLVGIFALALWECRRAHGRDPTVALVGFGLLVMTMASGLSGPMLDAYPFNLLFWASLGWLANLGSSRAWLEAEPRPPVGSTRAALAD